MLFAVGDPLDTVHSDGLQDLQQRPACGFLPAGTRHQPHRRPALGGESEAKEGRHTKMAPAAAGRRVETPSVSYSELMVTCLHTSLELNGACGGQTILIH